MNNKGLHLCFFPEVDGEKLRQPENPSFITDKMNLVLLQNSRHTHLKVSSWRGYTGPLSDSLCHWNWTTLFCFSVANPLNGMCVRGEFQMYTVYFEKHDVTLLANPRVTYSMDDSFSGGSAQVAVLQEVLAMAQRIGNALVDLWTPDPYPYGYRQKVGKEEGGTE